MSQSRVNQSRTNQGRANQSRTNQGRANQSSADPSRVNHSRSGQSKYRKRKQPIRSRLLARGNYYDFNLLIIVILLTCFGLIMIYSTSAYIAELTYGNGMYYFTKQLMISAVFLVGAVIISQLDYHLLSYVSPFIYLLSAILLIVVRFIGVTVNGATRWIKITESIRFQPAELAKLALIIFLPFLIIKMGKNIKRLKATFMILGCGGLLAFFTYLFTDNLSSAIIIAGITVVLLFVAHPKTIPFVVVGGAGVGVVAAVVAYLVKTAQNSDNFRIERILVWLEPESYASGKGYQILQALYAIGSGGFFGKGLGNSTQKLGAVPEAQNDMIFSIVCEELGVFGAAMLTILFILLLYRLLFIARNAPDLYGSLMVTGIFVHIALQVILNISVVINLIPTTGITLPFISYGGTSVMFLMAEMALALSVSRRITFKD